jgi:uncharacterized protein
MFEPPQNTPHRNSSFKTPGSIEPVGEWPDNTITPPTRSGIKKFLLAGAALFVLLLVARAALSYWVELLWFNSLGYTGIFWKQQSIRWTVFGAFAAATFVILYSAFLLLRRAHKDDLPNEHSIFIAGQQVNLSVRPVLDIAGLIGPLLIALMTGSALSAQWNIIALYLHAPADIVSTSDPIFGKPLGFYLFTLPAWQLLLGWLLTMAVMIGVLALVFLFITGSTRVLGERPANSAPLSWRGLAIAASLLLFVLAMNVYLSRYQKLLDGHTVFQGVTYTDAHVTIPGLLLVSVMLALGGLIAAVSAFRTPRGKWLIAAALPAVVSYFLLGLVGWYVTSFLVKPNELVREGPYIEHNIEMTRTA